MDDEMANLKASYFMVQHVVVVLHRGDAYSHDHMREADK